MRDIGQVEFATMLHRFEKRIEVFLRPVRPLPGALQQLRKEALWQKLDAVGKEAEHELIDEVRHFLRRAPALQP